jgi:hypothetical protein
MATTSSKPSLVGPNTYKTDVTTNADGSLKATTFRTNPGTNPVAVYTVNTTKDGTTTRKVEGGATATEKTAFNNPNSTERKAVNDQIKDAKPYGTNPSAEQQKQINAAAGSPNQATTSPSGTNNQGATPPPTAAQSALAQEENKYRENTRAGDNAYDNLKYPENLAETLQDTVRFSILEYSPSLSKQNQSTTNGQFGSGKNRRVILESSGIPVIKNSKRLGTITLPIPAGISDGNTVGWQDDSMNMIQEAGVNLAKGFFEGGGEGVSKALDTTLNKTGAATKSGELRQAIEGIFFSQAVGGANVAGRAFGATFNNNLELLFSNPNLRTFSFTFSFYPRGEGEAVIVRKIIRAFKQSMSVKRSQTSLLLKAPHTFAISYVTAGGKAQPYLNSFKECALTSCSVDYTPDGTYMTYGGKEKSMTAYRLSLQFQELEPIFDDEYYDIDKNDDTSIGF